MSSYLDDFKKQNPGVEKYSDAEIISILPDINPSLAGLSHEELVTFATTPKPTGLLSNAVASYHSVMGNTKLNTAAEKASDINEPSFASLSTQKPSTSLFMGMTGDELKRRSLAATGQFQELDKDLQTTLDDAEYHQKEASKAVLSPTTQRFLKGSGEDESSIVDDFLADPFTIVTEIGASSAYGSLEALGTGALMSAAGPVGFALGSGLGSARVEFAATVAEELRESGIDLTNAARFREALSARPELLTSAVSKARKRAAAIGTADALTMGLASKSLGFGKGVTKQLTNMATQGAVQIGGGAAGEASAQLVTDGQITDGRAIAAEAVGELVTTPIDVAVATRTVLDNASSNIKSAGEEAAAAGGDALDQASARADTASQELPNAVATSAEIQKAREQIDSGAQDSATLIQEAPVFEERPTASHRDMSGIDGLIVAAERMGFADEVATLSTAKRVYQRAARAKAGGNERLAESMYRRADDLFRSATETNEQVQAVANQFPAPYVSTGEVVGGELDSSVKTEGAKVGETYDQPLEVSVDVGATPESAALLPDASLEVPENGLAPSQQDSSIDPEYTSEAKKTFWEEFNNGALRRGPGNSREAQKAWVEERITAGHGFDRGRPRVLAGTPGGGRETLFFGNGVAGFRGIVTDGQVTRNKAGQEVFTLRVIPPELMQKGATESASILTVSLKNTGNNEYEVGVLGPVEGGAAAQALAGTEYLSDTGKTSPQGLKYLKLNIGNTATKSFLSEAVRRLAMHNGKAPNAVIYSARDTGARAGDDTVRKFNRDTIESRFSRTPETQSLIDSIKSFHPEVKLNVTESDTQLEVSKIEVPPELRSKGIGSAVMEQIISHADKQQKTLVLTPSSDFGGNKAKLTAWYKRLGFVENKGRNRDYEISESMYRPVGAASFSRSSASRNTNTPISRDQVDAIAVRITADWANAPEMITVATDRELPADLQATIDEQNARNQIDGVFHNGRFYLVADKIRTEADVERIVLHEALGHYGLRQLYGSALEFHMDQLFEQVGGYSGIQQLGQKYGFDLSGYWDNSSGMSIAERRQMMADELVAHIAGTGKVAPDLIQRIAHIIRRGLRKVMSGTRFAESLDTMTDVEILRVVAAARKAVVKGEARVTTLTHDPRFVRAFEDAMYGEPASNDTEVPSTPSNAAEDSKPSTAGDLHGESLDDYQAKRSAHNFSEARLAAKDFQGSILVNEETQMEAVVSRNTLDKMLSRKAVTKSESPAGHSMAVANADHLFEKAVLGWSKADSKGEASIKAIHRYFAPFVVDGKASIVKLTVKETARSGQNNPLYSLESVELNETSAAWWVETVAKADGINLDSIRSAEVIYSLANAVEEYNQDTRFSRTQTPLADGFSAPEETISRQAISWIADKFHVLKKLQADIESSGGSISEQSDAYLAEELFHGKAENDLRLMRDTYIEPLAKQMVKLGITQEQLDQYLYAKHAPERNAHIASINPDLPDGGSGMTNAEAADVLRTVEADGKQADYEKLATIVYDLLESRRYEIRESGLEDTGLIDAWESKYEHYVPLKGFAVDEQQEGLPRSGKGFTIGGKESKRALGRKSQAASPSSYAIQDLTETLIRKRKNEVGNAFLALVEENPNTDYWQVFTDDSPEMDRRIVQRTDPETGNKYEEVVERPIPMAMLSDRYFSTKRDGTTYYIKLEDPRLMKAMKNIGPDSSNFFIQGLAKVNRFLSSVNTSFNPEFVVGNFARDIQTAVLNLSAEQSRADGKIQGEKIVKQTVKDVPVAMRAIYRSLRGKVSKNEWAAYFDEFREAGAKTGYFDMKDIDGQAADIQHLVDIAKGGVKGGFIKWGGATLKLVEDLNQSVENAVRLSAYVNARRAGVSKAKAASLAKNMTVNFNRRGEAGTTLNALYMFANASIQGSMNFARTMGSLRGEKGDPVWQRLHTAQKISAGLMAGSFAIAMANRAGAGDDEDGENWYDKVPQYVKERNLVIMKSLLGGEQDGSYWKIPLPYGYNIFHVFGTSVEAAAIGETSVPRAAADLMLATLGSFSPIGFQDSNSLSVGIMKNVAPTIAKPLVDVVANENFMGSSIYNENFPFGTPKPDSHLSRRSTPEGYKAIAEFLNEVSGGSRWRSGALDINPDVMRYFVNFVTGGAGAFVADKLPDNVYRVANGVDLPLHKTLFLRRVNGQVLPYADQSAFYDRRNEIGQTYAEFKALNGRERGAFYRENRGLISLRPKVKQVEKQLKVLRKRRDLIYAMNLSAAERDRRLKAIERDMKKVVDQFNLAYRRATQSAL
ncbi:LPD38 domain-containing protein [Neptunomonas sp. XY-337]|uniref:LPD38 domain-containing protein n=1 Tax=Neptunomonas sp. XY-337 TaxID=2561897 RepID=UPI0010AAA5E5|nr:LPD38 domain-containing protein [Neptunomonas sp. XY-337]